MTLVANKNHCMEAKIMERTSNQPTFLDSLTSDLGGRRTSEFFDKCNHIIPWNELAEFDKSSLSTQTKYFEEQFFQMRLVILAKTTYRTVVGILVCRDDFVRHIGLAVFFNPPAGSLACAIGVYQQANHHRRIKGRVANAIGAVFFVELTPVNLLDSIENKPGQMILGQPVSQRWRQQINLVSVAGQKIVSHIIILYVFNQSIAQIITEKPELFTC
jgi:hypothetical protein